MNTSFANTFAESQFFVDASVFRQLQADFGLLLEHCAQLTRRNDLLLQEKREDKEKIRALENLVEEKDGKIDKVVKDHVKVLCEVNEKKGIRLRQQRAYEKEINGLKRELKESQKQKENLKEDIDVLKKKHEENKNNKEAMLQVYKIEIEENKMKLSNQLEKLKKVNNELKEKNSMLVDQSKEIDCLQKQVEQDKGFFKRNVELFEENIKIKFKLSDLSDEKNDLKQQLEQIRKASCLKRLFRKI